MTSSLIHKMSERKLTSPVALDKAGTSQRFKIRHNPPKGYAVFIVCKTAKSANELLSRISSRFCGNLKYYI